MLTLESPPRISKTTPQTMEEICTKEIGMFINSYSTGDDMAMFVVQCGVVIIGIGLNVIAILLVVCIGRLRSVQGIAYVFNLSCADFLFCVVILFTTFGTKYNILSNKEVCYLATALTNFLCFTASASRFIIAIDRFMYIDDPLHYYNRSLETITAHIIVAVWLACACLAFVPYIPELVGVTGYLGKHCMPNEPALYEFSSLFLAVFCPMIYEILVYTRIYFWAYSHLRIMKKEANYCNVLRQRSVKESYNVDLRKLELFTRASLLMASTMFAIKADDEKEQAQHDEPEKPPTAWDQALRKVTLNSNVGNYISSIVTFGVVPKNDSPPEKEETTARRSIFTVIGSAIDKTEVSPEECCQETLVETLSIEDKSLSFNEEDVFIEEEMRRLSRKVEARGFKSGSKALYGAMSTMITCTELKATFRLFLTLGTLVLCWTYFISLSLYRSISEHPESYVSDRKLANIFVYSLSCVDPIVYDLLHQPIRKAVSDEIKQNLKHRSCM